VKLIDFQPHSCSCRRHTWSACYRRPFRLLTICSTVSWPMIPRRWPSITSESGLRAVPAAWLETARQPSDRFFVRFFTLICATASTVTANTLLGVQTLLAGDVERHPTPARDHGRSAPSEKSRRLFRSRLPSLHCRTGSKPHLARHFRYILAITINDHQDAKYEKPGDDHYFVWNPNIKLLFDAPTVCVERQSEKPLLR